MSLQALYVTVALASVLANAGMAVADLAGARFVLANSAEVGVPRSWVPGLGALKAAGAAGLVLGLAWVPLIGLAAAVGLVLFFVGALATHARAWVYHNIAFPGAYLALAAATLALGLATG
ncbi:DoxX family protein [Dactylosporangium sp. NPDC048998]|uniref:DoxX family protein n=1 Tax=Dactylosporangium sp. NPDC048998 TaxID=3363976 RepID=UPI003718F9FD